MSVVCICFSNQFTFFCSVFVLFGQQQEQTKNRKQKFGPTIAQQNVYTDIYIYFCSCIWFCFWNFPKSRCFRSVAIVVVCYFVWCCCYRFSYESICCYQFSISEPNHCLELIWHKRNPPTNCYWDLLRFYFLFLKFFDSRSLNALKPTLSLVDGLCVYVFVCAYGFFFS